MKIDYTRGKPFQEWHLSDLETLYRTPAEVEEIFLHYLKNKRRISVKQDYEFIINYIAENNLDDHYESLELIINRFKHSIIYSLENPSQNLAISKSTMYKKILPFYFNHVSKIISVLYFMNDDIMDIIKLNIQYNPDGADDFLIYHDDVLSVLNDYPNYLTEIKKLLIINNANIHKFVDGYSYINEVEYTMDDFYSDLPQEMSIGVVI